MMDINATLIGQMITFAILVWFTKRWVWPAIMQILTSRQETIATGLAQAEQAARDLELAQHQSEKMLLDAKAKAATLIEQANIRANGIVDDSKQKARAEGKRLLDKAKEDIVQQAHQARKDLLQEVASLAIVSSEKILGRELDPSSNDKYMTELVGEIEE